MQYLKWFLGQHLSKMSTKIANYIPREKYSLAGTKLSSIICLFLPHENRDFVIVDNWLVFCVTINCPLLLTAKRSLMAIRWYLQYYGIVNGIGFVKRKRNCGGKRWGKLRLRNGWKEFINMYYVAAAAKYSFVGFCFHPSKRKDMELRRRTIQLSSQNNLALHFIYLSENCKSFMSVHCFEIVCSENIFTSFQWWTLLISYNRYKFVCCNFLPCPVFLSLWFQFEVIKSWK